MGWLVCRSGDIEGQKAFFQGSFILKQGAIFHHEFREFSWSVESLENRFNKGVPKLCAHGSKRDNVPRGSLADGVPDRRDEPRPQP